VRTGSSPAGCRAAAGCARPGACVTRRGFLVHALPSASGSALARAASSSRAAVLVREQVTPGARLPCGARFGGEAGGLVGSSPPRSAGARFGLSPGAVAVGVSAEAGGWCGALVPPNQLLQLTAAVVAVRRPWPAAVGSGAGPPPASGRW
jgi:hypothetical protein